MIENVASFYFYLSVGTPKTLHEQAHVAFFTTIIAMKNYKNKWIFIVNLLKNNLITAEYKWYHTEIKVSHNLRMNKWKQYYAK